jgi:hypothetical protein
MTGDDREVSPVDGRYMTIALSRTGAEKRLRVFFA